METIKMHSFTEANLQYRRNNTQRHRHSKLLAYESRHSKCIFHTFLINKAGVQTTSNKCAQKGDLAMQNTSALTTIDNTGYCSQ